MKKTLFVTDLDGTLLTPEAKLPDGAADRINALTSEGVMITYATARTIRSVSFILKDIDFNARGCAPAALMNGVLVRDMKNGCYVRSAVIDRSIAEKINEAVSSDALAPFIYALDSSSPVNGDPLVTYYHSVTNEAMSEFMDERVRRYDKPFIKIDSLDEIVGDIVYFAVIGPEESIRRAAEKVSRISGIHMTFYRDAYSENVWYLEIFDQTASKKHAVHYLRQVTGAEQVVVFGDNMNDLPMFEEADISAAVENALPEVKNAADYVVSDVVEFIEKFSKNGEIK